ncbi:complement C5-like isoform X2 [Drosophila willistoni]|uniref:complement C5-like isoform X2 n=1 Tax=Drosophila willistoni TaxID=7260 RepID=UPI001F072BBE|nr:complement C5-like isoform X2 [Drosophila willistoni]
MCSSWINWWLVSSYVLLIFCGNVQSKSYYVISAAGSIFTGRPYGVVVTIFNSEVSSSCVVSLKGPNLDMQMQYNLTPQSPCRSHQFQMPATLKEGEYTLTVESVRGQYYRNSTRLNWEDTKSFVKIQTPKNHYRPGDGIRFRALYFNEQLKPVQPKSTTNIQIYDGNNNFVATYKNIITRDGIYRGKFQLANNPVFGLWRICIAELNIIMGDCAYFRVIQYVIPPFKVRIQTKRYVSLSDNSLPVFVKAYYASENNVEGNVNLFVHSYLDKETSETPISVHLTRRLKNGTSEFNISLAQFEKQIPQNKELLVHITASVNEGYTSDSANTTKLISLYRNQFIIECIHTTGNCRKLVGDKESIITYRITKLDGEIATTKLPVKLHYSSLSSTDTYSFTSQLKPNGVVNFPNVKILKSESENAKILVLNTEIEFEGLRNPMPNTTVTWLIARTSHVDHDKGHDKGHGHLHTKTKGLSVPAGTSEYVHFDVDHRYEYASCVVMSNGNVQVGHRVLPDVFGTVEAKIDFTQNMWPFVHLFLYGMERNSLFVALKTIGIQEQRNKLHEKYRQAKESNLK